MSRCTGRGDDERAQLHFGACGAWRRAEHSEAQHARAVGAVDAKGVAHEYGLIVHLRDDLHDHGQEGQQRGREGGVTLNDEHAMGAAVRITRGGEGGGSQAGGGTERNR